MLSLMFWASECQGARSVCTTPPNNCEGGVGVVYKLQHFCSDAAASPMLQGDVCAFVSLVF
jgi:hypothetical protein